MNEKREKNTVFSYFFLPHFDQCFVLLLLLLLLLSVCGMREYLSEDLF